MLAVRDENTEALVALVEGKADPNSRIRDGRGMSALQVALEEANEEDKRDEDQLMAQLLLECNADPNSKAGTMRLLHKAVVAKDNAAVAMLLRHKADVNVTENTGKTPHHLAARGGYDKGLEMLLGMRADTDALSVDGKTALQLAEVNRKAECVALLSNVERVQANAEEVLSMALSSLTIGGAAEYIRLKVCALETA